VERLNQREFFRGFLQDVIRFAATIALLWLGLARSSLSAAKTDYDPALSAPEPWTRFLADTFPETIDTWRSREAASIRDPGPDTANFPNSPYTLPRGWVYVETSPANWNAAIRNVQSAGWNWEYLVRVGITDRVEFRVFSNGICIGKLVWASLPIQAWRPWCSTRKSISGEPMM